MVSGNTIITSMKRKMSRDPETEPALKQRKIPSLEYPSMSRDMQTAREENLGAYLKAVQETGKLRDEEMDASTQLEPLIDWNHYRQKVFDRVSAHQETVEEQHAEKKSDGIKWHVRQSLEIPSTFAETLHEITKTCKVLANPVHETQNTWLTVFGSFSVIASTYKQSPRSTEEQNNNRQCHYAHPRECVDVNDLVLEKKSRLAPRKTDTVFGDCNSAQLRDPKIRTPTGQAKSRFWNY
ncbi:hypothetical protein BJ878DRAFT_482152 [Calycina marina]|uniref:Uncharacterized protein n=1 Tax=Calycina marina TaxID=1763456 RepID=A0A9P7YYI4_9HELO|nr:hypothetical protein BJ878DRAFT_482152 [Calycina marina]